MAKIFPSPRSCTPRWMALMAATQTDAVKDVVRSNTEAAMDLGIFGAPTMVYQGELFWGNDRLDVLKAVIQGRIKA